MMKLAKYLILLVIILAVSVWFGVKDSFAPLVRNAITHPIFTIGDASYQNSLSEGKSIIKFGPLFWGLYPGGLAFKSTREAIAFMQNNQNMLDKFSSGWAVYQLSGDFQRDTYPSGQRHYLKHSLLVRQPVIQP
ncbi:hypothetical protein [Endozoicomonas sp. 4G]|uniref:hypothetical protein n=1 Tax=Endozoicomonas sp. 4G TaxID=2872754 RepID=UPI0020789AE5|nr:hypothetical protein [Endozoicomonas sp. 4G]